MKNKGLIFGVIAAAVVLIAGLIVLGGQHKAAPAMMPDASSKNGAVDSNSAVAANTVSIDGYKFMPAAVKVKAGTTVTWTNNDSVHHNVVADTASSDAPKGPLFGKGETYTFKFTKAGTYTYHCEPHPYMHGTVVVTE